MTFSVVTPSLNQAAFASEMLESLHGQRGVSLEHIVFDAGSTDGSIEIFRDWERREASPAVEDISANQDPLSRTSVAMRVFVEPDRGQSDAINKGMRLASGDIVGWLNADDVLLPGALTEVADAFARHPDAVVVYGVGAKTDLDGQILKKVPFRDFCSKRLSWAFGAVQPAMFFKRDAFWRVGGLDEPLHYAMDWDLLLKLSKVGEVVAIPEHLANIRYYPETKTNTGGWKRMAEIARIARRHNGFFDRNNLSFQIRSLLAKQPFKLPKSLFDHLCWNLFRDPPLMVQGWPDEAQS